jgi:DNA-binding MarR family transcriptional regulator
VTARQTTVKGISPVAAAAVLRSAITLVSRRMRASRPVGELTPSQFSVLGSLDLAGALTPSELAESERVRPPTITRIVAKLEAAGLVRRTPHATDRRQVILEPTDQGRVLLRRAREAREAWLARRLAELDPDEQQVLHRAAEILIRIART